MNRWVRLGVAIAGFLVITTVCLAFTVNEISLEGVRFYVIALAFLSSYFLLSFVSRSAWSILVISFPIWMAHVLEQNPSTDGVPWAGAIFFYTGIFFFVWLIGLGVGYWLNSRGLNQKPYNIGMRKISYHLVSFLLLLRGDRKLREDLRETEDSRSFLREEYRAAQSSTDVAVLIENYGADYGIETESDLKRFIR